MKYKKEGDRLFDLGSYQDAMRNYALCMVEDDHENDKYAFGQMAICKRCIKLLEEAEEAVSENNYDKALAKWKEAVNLNKNDKKINDLVGEYLEKKGNDQFAIKEFIQAKESFVEAIRYRPNRRTTLDKIIKDCDAEIAKRLAESSKPIVQPKAEASTPIITQTESTKKEILKEATTDKTEPIKISEKERDDIVNFQLYKNDLEMANNNYDLRNFKAAKNYYESALEIAQRCNGCSKYNDELNQNLLNINHNISVIDFNKWRVINMSLLSLGAIGVGLFSNYYLGYSKAKKDLTAKQKLADPNGDNIAILSENPNNNKAYLDYQNAYIELKNIKYDNVIYNAFLGVGVTFGAVYLVKKIIGKFRPDNLEIIPYQKGLSLSYNF